MPKPMACRNRRCGHCDTGLTPEQKSFREVAADLACAGLLLAMFTLAGHANYQWGERQEHRFADFTFWHQPLDDRSLCAIAVCYGRCKESPTR
jgi:hypothetical protein